MYKKISNFQIGKAGITENFIKSLKTYFKKNKNLKISVLKNARDSDNSSKEIIKKYSKILSDKLGNNYHIRIIGFTIFIKRLKKDNS